MGIVLSHTTARAVYQTAHSIARTGIEPLSDAEINQSCPDKELIENASRWLVVHSIRLEDEAPLEVMVFNRNKGRTLSGCRCHVSSKRFSSSRFIRLDRNLYVVGIELCALQAATYLPFRELVEYYFELCGAYSLGTSSGIDVSYTERPQLTSTADLKRFFNTLNACDGLIAARKAIKCVRDGCRSPMETAFVMMLTLPKRDGGLGIRAIETDYEVKVPSNARALTRRTRFYMDAYLKRSRTDIEYNGFHHDTDEGRAIDEERKNALASMGYGIITISRHSFMRAAPFTRVMEAIQRKEGIRHSRLPEDFGVKQENLRRFVLRRFTERQRLIEEKRQQDTQERHRLDYENALLNGVIANTPVDISSHMDGMQYDVRETGISSETGNDRTEGMVFGSSTEAVDRTSVD